MTTDLETQRAQYVERVDPEHTLKAEWRAALRDVPHDLFVPAFIESLADRPGWRVVCEPKFEWAEAVLSNRALITQLNGDDEAPLDGQVEGWATSSSSQPSLMVLMLHALGVQHGQHVLEIGTGSGYNAALLCHRLGSDAVTTMDIDPAVTGRARTRLGRLGYHPEVVTGDGMEGCPLRASYDRVIATVAVQRLPQAWIEQTRDGGRILLPLDTRNGGGLMPLLTVCGGTAEGRFLPDYGGFMPVRQQTRHDAAQTAFRQDTGEDDSLRSTPLAHDAVTDEADPFAFFAALFTGGYDQMSFTPNDGGQTETWIALPPPDGAWVCHTTDSDGNHHVRQGGPQRLWDRLEHLHARWTQLGRPERDRFGLTVTLDGQHTVWLDAPDGQHRWHLHSNGVPLRVSDGSA